MILVYGLKTCDTCRKAIRAMMAAGLEVRLVDVREEGVPEAEMRQWLEEHGITKLLNMRSTTWRGLGEDERGKAGSETGARALMADYPPLMKRPVIVAGGKSYVGWTADVQAALLPSAD